MVAGPEEEESVEEEPASVKDNELIVRLIEGFEVDVVEEASDVDVVEDDENPFASQQHVIL